MANEAMGSPRRPFLLASPAADTRCDDEKRNQETREAVTGTGSATAHFEIRDTRAEAVVHFGRAQATIDDIRAYRYGHAVQARRALHEERQGGLLRRWLVWPRMGNAFP